MRKREWEQAPYDFIFEPRNEKVEHKYSALRKVEHCCVTLDPYSEGVTLRFLWKDIAEREFDWLLLSGEYFKEGLYFWLLPERIARELLTKSNGGQISFVLKNRFARRSKAALLDSRRITLEQLRARCEKGDLAGRLTG
jgi:hypothetical protein